MRALCLGGALSRTNGVDAGKILDAYIASDDLLMRLSADFLANIAALVPIYKVLSNRDGR